MIAAVSVGAMPKKDAPAKGSANYERGTEAQQAEWDAIWAAGEAKQQCPGCGGWKFTGRYCLACQARGLAGSAAQRRALDAYKRQYRVNLEAGEPVDEILAILNGREREPLQTRQAKRQEANSPTAAGFGAVVFLIVGAIVVAALVNGATGSPEAGLLSAVAVIGLGLWKGDELIR